MSASTEANPKPCNSPNAKAMRARLSVTTGKMLFRAATMIDAAITDSVSRLGRRTTSNAAKVRVIECARVNAVTTFNMLKKAGLALGAGPQGPLLFDKNAGGGAGERHT